MFHTQALHNDVRQACIRFMERNKEHFEPVSLIKIVYSTKQQVPSCVSSLIQILITQLCIIDIKHNIWLDDPVFKYQYKYKYLHLHLL